MKSSYGTATELVYTMPEENVKPVKVVGPKARTVRGHGDTRVPKMENGHETA